MSHNHLHGHCHEEAHGHDHGHGGHGGHGHSHDHSNDITPAIQTRLYQQIDFGKIVTLNEAEAGAGAAIVRKTWDQRLDEEPELASDTDEQLLMLVPFTGQVKLHSISLLFPPGPPAPKTLKLFRNREDLDFTTAADLQPTQTLVVPPVSGAGQQREVVELPVNRAQFNATTSITLFIEDNYGDGDEDVTRLSYVGFKGQFTGLSREPVSFLYEAAANPRDHVVMQGLEQGGSTIGPGS